MLTEDKIIDAAYTDYGAENKMKDAKNVFLQI